MQFTIWLTYRCNMKCTYCYEGSNKKTNTMTFNCASKILIFIKEMINECNDNISINFHGGEPLLAYDILVYLINEIKSWNKNIWLHMTTNATLLDTNKVEFLLNNLDEISISIDGDIKSHNLNRKYLNGLDTFEDIMKVVPQLLLGNCIILARMTLTPDTVKDLSININYLSKVGFKKIIPIIDQYDKRWNKDNKKLLEEEFKKIIDDHYIKDSGISVGMIEEIKYRRESKCLAGIKTMHISPEGDLYPCAHVMEIEKLKIGDVLNGLDRDKVIQLRSINEEKLVDCVKCGWYKLCPGVRCKLINYAIGGNFYKPPAVICMYEGLLRNSYNYRIEKSRSL